MGCRKPCFSKRITNCSKVLKDGQDPQSSRQVSLKSSKGKLQLIFRFFEVNYSALMIERLILDDIRAEVTDMFFELCQRQTHKIQEMQSYFRNTPSDLSSSIMQWLECSAIYYRMLSVYALFVKNNHMIARIIEKTKDIETIYFENNMLANSILDTKDAFIQMAERIKAYPSLVEFPNHGLSFFNEKLERELKKAITTYESIKGDLNVKKFTGVTVDALLNASFQLLEEDKLERKLLEESGLSVPQSEL